MAYKRPTKEKLEQREREQVALELRNTSIMDDLIKGMSKKAIAAKYELSVSTVGAIIEKARDVWKEYRVEDYDLMLTIELERIKTIEDEAWDAWNKSKEPLITQTRRTEKGDDEATAQKVIDEIKKQQRHPDPRYLDRMSWCIEQRLRIMGAYAPDKVAATTPDGKQSAPFTRISFIEVVRPPEAEKAIDVEVQALPAST